jgi:sugar/nucleoside kinase (ribokinase family)
VTKSAFDVLAIGDLVVDFVVQIDSFPVEAGHFQIDHGHVLEPGGACNLLIAASRIGLSSAALSRVGDDLHGRFLLDVLGQEGVDVSAVEVAAQKRTVVVLTLVAGGEHTFIGGMSASPDLTIPDAWRQKIGASRALFVEGYAFAELSPGMTIDAIATAQAAGTPVFFDPGPEVHNIGQERLELALAASRVALLTAEEAALATGVDDPVQAARRLLDFGPEWVVVKQGAAGCAICTEKNALHIPGFAVTVQDTSGAGDSFDAGVIYGYLHGWSPERTGRFANAIGAVTVSKLGAGRQVATLAEVEALLRQRAKGEGKREYTHHPSLSSKQE